jgi:hypothetical protein
VRYESSSNENRVMLLLTFSVWMCRLDSASNSLFLEEGPAAGGNYFHRKAETWCRPVSCVCVCDVCVCVCVCECVCVCVYVCVCVCDEEGKSE